ncbi:MULTISPECIES: hypothetical protein [unclassified Arthrobacter]|uniref:hypothetical protein n=1 Tax=unclassified Arthrobacter TaxID=235627 RepID=UPI001D13AA92|nr:MULTISPECIES: hypothetical protein [unclassified Arthrobacter]MCC3289577.1 hypothetical protein [Arthrobacter sp. zg-Y1110]MCC3300905.1 hypothetical protein [Arthrobacter sp. zg-Y895]UWX84993.1 hypothetical protein N2K99_16345 [Arthrobacter sp. zg-Y1110]
MPELSLPNTTLPKNNQPGPRTGLQARLPNDAAGSDEPLLPRARPPEQAAPVLRRAAKGVYTMLKRLRSSFLRSNAVHQARMDAALTGEQGHLLMHYFNSVK